ncbi:BON domain-containing protein [Noviherbaspirillum saxi]|uniref:BON domain-containing protein n=1 Tax=Noviherbaspirillum saxi TaxID=2320863 RepID=A0A3A3G3N7_9BURK|nr:BON domain-containing protein [Noviherbaspirillum saxi]RJF96026.1 BON domain-containing protein [Noviherbaspirillum saxi]
MKTIALTGLLLSSLLLAGCAGMTDSQGKASAPAPQAANSDATISQKVKDGLQGDPDTAGQKVNVDTAQGKVTLKGEVQSVAAFRKAPTIAKAVAGVVAVDNQLIVCMTCK